MNLFVEPRLRKPLQDYLWVSRRVPGAIFIFVGEDNRFNARANETKPFSELCGHKYILYIDFYLPMIFKWMYVNRILFNTYVSVNRCENFVPESFRFKSLQKLLTKTK